MSDLAPGDFVERRRGGRVQRDWLGHGLQLLGIAVVLGIPLLIWGTSINTTVATIVAKTERQERDITDQGRIQSLVNTQLNDVANKLTRIDTQLEGMLREPKKR